MSSSVPPSATGGSFRALRNVPPSATHRGLTPETVNVFGVGYCPRGLMRGRVAIPIRNERGELVAYAGRAVTEDQGSP